MELRTVDINTLIPYENNPRKNDGAVAAVAESIRQCGYVAPIIVDENMVVLAGHTRLKALKSVGGGQVDVIVRDGLTEEQKKKYRILDNKTNEFADWDMEALEKELEGLDFEGFDFDLNIQVENDQTEVKEDDYDGEVPEEPQAKRGDIYKLGRHRLMCGDSTSITDVNLLIGDAKIGICITDPPYGVDVVKDNKVGADFGIAKKGEYFAIKGDDTTETAEEFYHTCISAGIDKYILFGGNYFTEFLPFSDGWLIWDKRTDSGIRNTFADGEMAWCSFHTPVRIYHQLWVGMIREGEHEKRVHPTQKPVRLLGEIINDFTEQGENVIDCFGGSGTTLIACEQTGRNCYMIEYEPKYVDVIIDRWEKFTGLKAELLN